MGTTRPALSPSSPPSAPAPAWAGTSTTTTSSMAPNASSAPATSPTSPPAGFPPSTASPISSSTAAKQPTSAAASAPPPSSCPGLPRLRALRLRRHAGSIELARAAAKCEGLSDRIHFDVAPAKVYPGKDYDFVTFFDCFHDMGDPIGAAAHVRSTLKPDGTWMVVEPYAEDLTEANHNPVGRVFCSASALLCVPASLS